MKIPFNRATIGPRERELLGQVVMGGQISGNGPLGKQVELALAELTGTSKALLTTSCTHALELAASLLDLGPGDEVIVPSYTFVTTASAFLKAGGVPVFADVDNQTLNLTPESIQNVLSPRTKAVVVVHYAGISSSLEGIVRICDREGLVLIEDNAHGLGGSYAGKPLGSWGQLSTLSFHETKNITCGEGGAICFSNTELVERAEILREKGTDRSRFLRGEVDKYTWIDVGSSWVLSEILAAILQGQVDQFNNIQVRRSAIWNRYMKELKSWCSDMGIRFPHVPSGSTHPAHLFYLQFPSLDDRQRYIDHMKQQEIQVAFHYQALNESPVGLSLGAQKGQCPVSENAARTIARLPLFRGMSDEEVSRVIEASLNFS